MDQARPAGPADDPVSALIEALLSALAADAADSFAGLRIAGDGAVELLATGDGEEVRRTAGRVRASLPVVPALPPIRVLAGRANSLRALERVRDAVGVGHAIWGARGVRIVEWGVDEAANRVRIGVEGRMAEAEGALLREFGADRAYVFEGGRWTFA